MSIRENSVEWQSQRESHCSVGLAIKLYLETIKIATIRMALIKDVLNKTSEKNGLCLLLSLHFPSVCNRGWWRFLPQGNIITLYSYDERWGLLVVVTAIIFRLELSIQWSAVEFCCDIIVHDTHNLVGQSSDGTLWFLSLFTIHHSFPWASFRKTVRILEQKKVRKHVSMHNFAPNGGYSL